MFADFFSRWRDATPYLLFCAFFFAWGDILFGLDTGSFGSLEALPSFLNHFGENGALSTWQKSVMNSIVWPGKLAGVFAFEPLLHRVGYKKSVYFCCVIQFIAIIIEITAKEWVQYEIGRILAYFAVGIIENVVPSYQAEISPASLRGFITGSMISVVTLGNMWGAGMGQAMAKYTTNAGWQIPTGVQFIPALILAVAIPFTIESPRWLVLKGRKEQALQNLNKIRPQKLSENGVTSAEIDAIDFAIESNDALDQGSWSELFRGTYLRRTVVAGLLFWFQQTAGGQFVNSYGPTFFKQMGYGDLSFTYSFLATVAGCIAATIGMLFVDKVGRRPLMISGMFFAALFNFIIAGIGTKETLSKAETNAVIASLILLNVSCKYSASLTAYLITSEIGGIRMRKKIMAFATAIDVLSAFVITFCIPYLLGTPGANLGAGVGWILGGDAILGCIFAIFFVPELTGRSLEEVDELFEAKLWAWQFKGYKTSGIGHRIAILEEHDATNKGFGEEVTREAPESSH
ncbi:general substrate transporter [Cryphonectria parasitica EP155]|uniref:General substrate transporter n=1 Tax=Cryphonectria parasitica (strain ATCC 38755 / EP155) TaxID=660469 RepID=A0A9P5CNP8_CRYP1|nr:general substrate transporter [Cryphonectria parasitica EP155]KAF3764346.1 general substrate transporter [Cryphonectria parasitica EP155]